MRVAIVGPFGLCLKGTMSQRALPMAKALAAMGHRVHMIIPPWDCPQDAGREWKEDNVTIHNITLPPPVPCLRHLIITWRLARRIWNLKPDVVHCFKPKGYAGLVQIVLWFLRRFRPSGSGLVVDTDDWEGWGGWNELGDYSWLQKRVFAWQEKWGLTHCDAVTVASRALQTIVWSLGVVPDKVFYVPNGVTKREKGPPAGDSKKPLSHPLILLYTRFVEFRVERAIEIFRRVLAELPGSHLLVIGKGFRGEEKTLQRLASEHGLVDKIIYTGWVEQGELSDYLAAAEVAIYPFDDTLVNRTKCSVKLIDLMAAGSPVVADDVGQNREYIEQGVSGLLIQPGDTEAFAQAVVNLLRDESLRRSMGEAAQRRIHREFAWAKLVEGTERAYQLARRTRRNAPQAR